MTPGATIDELRARLRERLRPSVESPALEADLLVAAALGGDRLDLARRASELASAAVAAASDAFAARRLRGEPIALIVGAREFWGRRFALRPGVLVPRPETEHLVEAALAASPRGLWADVGTGSGCIALTLLLERAGADGLRCLAIDRSPVALACAAQNARELGAAARVTLVRGDLLAPLPPRPCLDGVVSNPPYVEPEEWSRLPPDVREFEPRLALTPETGSAATLRGRLIAEAAARLKPAGFLAIEVGAGQAGTAREQLLAAGFRDVAIVNDLAAIGRVVSGRWPGGTS